MKPLLPLTAMAVAYSLLVAFCATAQDTNAARKKAIEKEIASLKKQADGITKSMLAAERTVRKNQLTGKPLPPGSYERLSFLQDEYAQVAGRILVLERELQQLNGVAPKAPPKKKKK